MGVGRATKQTEDAAQDEEYEAKRLQPTWMLEEDLLIWLVMAVPPTSSGVSTSPPPSYSFSNGKLTKGKGKGGKSKGKGGQRPVFEKVTEGHFGSCVPAVASLVTTVMPAQSFFEVNYTTSQSPVKKAKTTESLSTWSTPMLILAILEHYVEPWTIEPAVSG